MSSSSKSQTLVMVIVVIMIGQAGSVALGESERRDSIESCHLRELEMCSMGLTSIFQNPNGLPVKEAELKRQCEFFNESIHCFHDYQEECLTGLQHGVADMFVMHPRGMVGDFCRSNSELRRNYTKHVECLRDYQRKYQRTCLMDLQVGFETIHKMNVSLRLTTACCNLNRLKECLFEPMEEECGAEAAEFAREVLENVVGTWFSLPCRAYDPEEEPCVTMLPKRGTKPSTARATSALSRIVSTFTNVPSPV